MAESIHTIALMLVTTAAAFGCVTISLLVTVTQLRNRIAQLEQAPARHRETYRPVARLSAHGAALAEVQDVQPRKAGSHLAAREMQDHRGW